MPSWPPIPTAWPPAYACRTPRRSEPLDTAGAIRFAARHGGVDSTFVAVNGDVLTDVDVTALIACHRRHQAWATLHLTAVDDPSRFGVVSTDEEGRVLAFVEKPAPGEAPSNLINAGTYILEPEVLDRIATEGPVSIERTTFPDLAAAGPRLRRGQRRLLARRRDARRLPAGARRSSRRYPVRYPRPRGTSGGGGVWVLGNPTVRGDVRPFSLIGDAADIAPGARVTSSVIGAGSVIEAGAVIEGSVLLPGVHVGPGASVSGSILGRRASVAEDCVVATLTVVGDDEVLRRGVHLSEARVPA